MLNAYARYLTPLYLADNFTQWGFQDCQFDPTDGSYGGMLTKLLFRHLPEYYPPTSAYAHFPFLVPNTMKGYLARDNGEDLVKQYSWDRPQGPVKGVVTASSYEAVKQVVQGPTFKNQVEKRLDVLTRGVGTDARLVSVLSHFVKIVLLTDS